MRVLVFGNPLLKNDNLPLKIIPYLRKEFGDVEFSEADPADLDLEEGKLIIIDSAKGVKKVTLLEDLKNLKSDSMLSTHGLGLAEQLALMQAAGKEVEVKIICVPENISQKKAVEEISKILRSI